MSNITQGSALTAEDIYPRFAHKFNVDAQITFITRKSQNMLYQYNIEVSPGVYVRQVTTPTFIGFTTTASAMDEAVEILADKINVLAENGYLLATLAPLMAIELAREPIIDLSGTRADNTLEGETKIAVVSYIFLKDPGKDWVKENIPHLETKEGAVPNILM